MTHGETTSRLIKCQTAIIDDFTVVSNVTGMPQTELCSTCYLRKLAMMQASPYSVYNEDYKQQLEYVYTKCGGSGPTAIPPSPDSPPAITPSSTAASGTWCSPGRIAETFALPKASRTICSWPSTRRCRRMTVQVR